MRAADIVEQGLAATGGASDHVATSVIVRDGSAVNLRWACNTLTTNGFSTDRTVSVVAAVRTAAGVCAATVTRSGDGDDIAELAADALAAARLSPPAEDATDLPTGTVDGDFVDEAQPTGPTALVEFANELSEALEEFRSAQAELFGFAQQAATTTWLGTSAGTRRRHVQPTGTAEFTGKSHQRSRSTYANQRGRHLSEIKVADLAEQLRDRLGWQARTVEVPAGRYDTVLPATSVADLIIDLYWALDARAAAEGQTVFSRAGGGTRLDDVLSGTPLTIRSDPDDPDLGCLPFVASAATSPTESVFDNGLPLESTTWVDGGRLTALAGSRHSARLAGVEARPGIDNLVMSVDDGAGTLEDLIARTDRGLLVTSLWYIREVDPMTELLTGLTRDGVYWVQGGEVVGATTNFRFNDSPVDLLGRIRAASATAPTLSREWNDWFTRTAMPALSVADFNMSTVAKGT